MVSTLSLCRALHYTYYVTTCGSFARRDERFCEGLSYRDHAYRVTRIYRTWRSRLSRYWRLYLSRRVIMEAPYR